MAKTEKVMIGGVHPVDKSLVPNNVVKMMADFPVKELFDDNRADWSKRELLQKWYTDKFGKP